MENLKSPETKSTPALIETIKLPLTEFHVERINRIDNEDFTKVTGKVKRDFAKIGVEVTDEYLD